jgi:hypothetical protein
MLSNRERQEQEDREAVDGFPTSAFRSSWAMAEGGMASCLSWLQVQSERVGLWSDLWCRHPQVIELKFGDVVVVHESFCAPQLRLPSE